MKSSQKFTLYILHQEIFSHTVIQCTYGSSFVSSYKMHFDGSKGVFPRDRNYFFPFYHDKSGIISTGSLPTKYVLFVHEPRNLFLFRFIHPPIISRKGFSINESRSFYQTILSIGFSPYISKTSPSLRKLSPSLSLSLYTFILSLFNLSTVSYA